MGPGEEAIMNDPGQVRVSGPLSAHRDGFGMSTNAIGLGQ